MQQIGPVPPVQSESSSHLRPVPPLMHEPLEMQLGNGLNSEKQQAFPSVHWSVEEH